MTSSSRVITIKLRTALIIASCVFAAGFLGGTYLGFPLVFFGALPGWCGR